MPSTQLIFSGSSNEGFLVLASQVSFGEGQMGMSLKNVDARAEVSKTEPGESEGKLSVARISTLYTLAFLLVVKLEEPIYNATV